MTCMNDKGGIPTTDDGSSVCHDGVLPFEPVDLCPALPEMAVAWERGNVEYVTAADGIALPVRVFGATGRGTPVVLLHGLQSHSGWFVQSSARIASLGRPVYAPDRRGSGLSRQRRGHAASFRQITDDIGQIVQYVIGRHGEGRIHLVGHCFGAIPAILFACKKPAMLASLVLTTPALSTRVNVPLLEKVAITISRLFNSTRYFPIPFSSDLLTDMPAYRDFIRHDPLSLHEVTAPFLWRIFWTRLSLPALPHRLPMPVFMALAGKDFIANNDKNEKFFRRIQARHKRLETYPEASHILEFSSERERFLHDLTEWIRETSSCDSGGCSTHGIER